MQVNLTSPTLCPNNKNKHPEKTSVCRQSSPQIELHTNLEGAASLLVYGAGGPGHRQGIPKQMLQWKGQAAQHNKKIR